MLEIVFNCCCLSSLCTARIRFFLRCDFRITQLPNIKIGNVGLLHSNHVFSSQKEPCARLTGLRETRDRGLAARAVSQRAMEGKGHVWEAWQEQSMLCMQSRGSTPQGSAGCPQLHPHLPHRAGAWLQQHQFCCVISQLGSPLCLRGGTKEILSRAFPFPASPACDPTGLHIPKCSLLQGIHCKGRAARIEPGTAQS